MSGENTYVDDTDREHCKTDALNNNYCRRDHVIYEMFGTKDFKVKKWGEISMKTYQTKNKCHNRCKYDWTRKI